VETMQGILHRIAPGEDGRIRCFLNPAGTETGRMSGSESFLVRSTNLLNMPKKEAAHDARYDVRRCFVPDPGTVFVEADLSGAEAWVSAALAGDDTLLAMLREGVDVHKWTAGKIFHKPGADVTPAERVLGKMARHALNYGMQPTTFWRNVNAGADATGVAITQPQARTIHDAYHALHPHLARWWERVDHALRQRGTLTTVFGRRRMFFGRRRGWLDETHREAIAFEPQSTVADLLNRGLLRWWDSYEGKLGALLLPVYDSMLVQCAAGRVALVRQALERCLREPLTVNGHTFTIPVETKMSAESWADVT